MTMHLGAFAESVDPDTVLTNIAGVSDDTILVNGDDMRVPVALPFLVAEAALINLVVGGAAQIQSPSLRQVANIDIAPVGLGLTFALDEEISVHGQAAIPLRGDEALNFLVNGTATAAAINYGLVWFGDGPQQPVTGAVYPVKATSTILGVADGWVNGSLAFAQDLPVGNYDIVGMQAFGTGLVACRLNFIGGAWRPGVPGAINITGPVGRAFRHGKMGVFGSFHTNTPPSIDVLASAASTLHTVILDLVFRG